MDSFSLTIKGKAAAAAACFDWSLKEGLEYEQLLQKIGLAPKPIKNECFL